MADISPITLSVVTSVVVAFLLWFALGTQRNVRRGSDTLRWLQTGLPLVGKRTTVRWLGSSAVQLELIEPRPPFRKAEIVVVLEPRDLSWLWALNRARGRRDFIILRARLERSPGFELEAGDVRGWTGRDRLKRLDPDGWQRAEWGDEWVRVAHSKGSDPEAVRRQWQAFDAASGGVWRLSVRRDHPHLEVHVRLPRTTEGSAEPLFEALRGLAALVMRPRT
jgi:hypothetical protein